MTSGLNTRMQFDQTPDLSRIRPCSSACSMTRVAISGAGSLVAGSRTVSINACKSASKDLRLLSSSAETALSTGP